VRLGGEEVEKSLKMTSKHEILPGMDLAALDQRCQFSKYGSSRSWWRSLEIGKRRKRKELKYRHHHMYFAWKLT
jgi:hypothetical protein